MLIKVLTCGRGGGGGGRGGRGRRGQYHGSERVTEYNFGNKKSIHLQIIQYKSDLCVKTSVSIFAFLLANVFPYKSSNN